MSRLDRSIGTFKRHLKRAPFPHPSAKACSSRAGHSKRRSDKEGPAEEDLTFNFALPARGTHEDSEYVQLSGSDPNNEMGKSNKFDFSNRPNSGVKLGNSIASTLAREAGKIITKARKQSTDSTTSSDKDLPSHSIDLQAPNKHLGDDGLCTLADGLEAALRSGNSLASLALEDLNLSGNGLTTAALARLAPIIDLARHDLKTLNLADNKIKVATNEEAEQWEAFLVSFRDCFRLRRLDLSNNVELGVHGFEIFARVHANEPAVTPMPPGGSISVLSLVSEKSAEDGEAGGDFDGVEDDDAAMAKSLSDATLLKRRCGLRSIPYITLHQTSINDAAALWLSYVLEDHFYPDQLTDDLNGIHACSSIKTYQQGVNSGGIDWDQNRTTLGKEGLALLQKTETVRRQSMLEDQSTLAGSVLMEDSVTAEDSDMQTRRMSIGRRYSRSLPGNRRASIRSIHTIDGGEHEASELESARRKIQRHVIEHDKVSSVELWQVALKVLKCSRLMLIMAPSSRMFYTGEALFNLPAQTTAPQAPPPGFAQIDERAKKLSIDTDKASASHRGSYAATLSATSGGVPGEPELAITEVTNSPVTPKMIFKPHRKGAFSDGADLPAVTQKLNGLIVQYDDPQRFIKYQRKQIAGAVNGKTTFRDMSIPSHLPQQVIERIMGFALPDSGHGVLSEEQRRAAFLWGQDRASLKVGLEWRRKDEASQVWMMLDSIKCLAYGQ